MNSTVYHQPPFTGPADITRAGGLSYYGTMGQGGNVWEWEETDYDLVNDSSSSARGLRGGSWFSGDGWLSVRSRRSAVPSVESVVTGFRVASKIPEPRTILLGALTLTCINLNRRQQRQQRDSLSVSLCSSEKGRKTEYVVPNGRRIS